MRQHHVESVILANVSSCQDKYLFSVLETQTTCCKAVWACATLTHAKLQAVTTAEKQVSFSLGCKNSQLEVFATDFSTNSTYLGIATKPLSYAFLF